MKKHNTASETDVAPWCYKWIRMGLDLWVGWGKEHLSVLKKNSELFFKFKLQNKNFWGVLKGRLWVMNRNCWRLTFLNFVYFMVTSTSGTGHALEVKNLANCKISSLSAVRRKQIQTLSFERKSYINSFWASGFASSVCSIMKTRWVRKFLFEGRMETKKLQREIQTSEHSWTDMRTHLYQDILVSSWFICSESVTTFTLNQW